MTDQDKRATDVDDLVRQVFSDDLPDDVAAAMSRRIDAFLAEAQAPGRETSSRKRLLPRVAWAAIAILMLLAGAFLQGAKVSSPLADRISSVKTAYAGLEPLRR